MTLGTINFFDTHIGAWEETEDYDSVEKRFRSLMEHLRRRGFEVNQDASVALIIRHHYYLGSKGDLEFRAETHGRMFQVEFFQNLVVEHPSGGYYESRKFKRMPRTMQFQCVVEMSHVLHKLLELGYILEGTRQGIVSADLLSVLRHAQGRTDEGDPLAQFNRSWNFPSDWKTGGRFQRDASGWPTIASVAQYDSNKDKDGLPLVSGEMMYCRHEGRLYRGIARPAPNSSWMLISNGSSVSVHAKALFRCDNPANLPRRYMSNQKVRVRGELDKALKANNYKRVATLACVLSRLEAPKGNHE